MIVRAADPTAKAAFEAHGVGLVAERGPDGLDYTRWCDDHQWASHPSATPETTGQCPYCSVAMDNKHGLTRWLRLKGRMS